ncbi:unnamed protein product [Rotaria sordida]|uniref:NAD(P)(+)--arginine ADP-ribosyltransferase n=1 Tax=Rotaria sordida TaxID=392033 RepID=A0A814DZX1_9BILA|nr:unnamed protein product [Rotaria sordida]CAF4049930.1 unnamed protein product [Rotaria sordida]
MSKTASSHENLANSRYTDIIGEPVARLLSPIKGYEAVPLVSLEEAVVPIGKFFDCIEENVWIAKENSKNPPDGLNQDESAALHLYTMQFDSDLSFYQLLNSTLRGENRDNLKPWFSYLKLFMTALHKLPSHSQTIWRGVRGIDLSKQYPTGSKFAWWGVSSCTANVEVLQAETFLGKTGMRTLFSIESQNGKSVAPHSYFKDTEKEIVLMPGSYFEVIGQLNPADDLYIIQMKELQPPFPFVKPPFKKELQATNVPKSLDNVTSSPTDNSSMPNVSSNESASSTTTMSEVKETSLPPKPSKPRIFSSTLPPPMQEAIVNIIREAIAEGTDEQDIESIITSELIQRYGGTCESKLWHTMIYIDMKLR